MPRSIFGTIAGWGLLFAGCAPWLYASPAGAREAEVKVRIEPQRAVISNEYLSLEHSLAHGQVRTTSIQNLRASKTFRAQGEDFVLEFADGRTVKSSDVHLEQSRMEASDREGKRLVFELSLDDLRLRLITEMHAADWWATRWLEITGGTGHLAGTSLARWQSTKAIGPAGAGNLMNTLGYPGGCGQVVYSEDLFFAIAHPGAENFAAGGLISCRIPAWEELGPGKTVLTHKMVIGAGERGAARRAFLKYIDATRAVPSRMVFLVNDWYWKDKSRPLEAFRALALLKKEIGIPIDSFTLDDGWDFDWDDSSGLWGRLNRTRFPGGWEALEALATPSGIGISLWFGPIGGYSFRPKRIEFARHAGYEINRDKLCLAGPRYRAHVIESFSRWAALGMDYIKVDGFWPDCQKADHGHPVDPGGAIAQMDSLAEIFASWRRARPGLVIAYTSGSSPSPFWLQHADFVWRGGRDDSHAGAGEPFDRNNSFLDTCLQAQRTTEMPMSAFVTFDIVQGRIAGNSDEAFERGVWWLAARTSLHHDWYVQSSDLTTGQWKLLAQAARWAKGHEKLFRWSRMVGGDPAKEQVYGFSAFDEGRGVLALRNPGSSPRALEATLASLVELPESARSRPLRLRGVYGETSALEGDRSAEADFRLELPPLAIAVLELESVGR
jgi:hypothetical protein